MLRILIRALALYGLATAARELVDAFLPQEEDE